MSPNPAIPGTPYLTTLQQEYQTLQTNIGLGVREVRFQDRTVVYPSIADMIRASNYLYQVLNPQAVRQVRFFTTKGL
ncbi:MAG TPA: hypothetical protein VIX19_11640 [Terriglobales bacterium]